MCTRHTCRGARCGRVTHVSKWRLSPSRPSWSLVIFSTLCIHGHRTAMPARKRGRGSMPPSAGRAVGRPKGSRNHHHYGWREIYGVPVPLGVDSAEGDDGTREEIIVTEPSGTSNDHISQADYQEDAGTPYRYPRRKQKDSGEEENDEELQEVEEGGELGDLEVDEDEVEIGRGGTSGRTLLGSFLDRVEAEVDLTDTMDETELFQIQHSPRPAHTPPLEIDMHRDRSARTPSSSESSSPILIAASGQPSNSLNGTINNSQSMSVEEWFRIYQLVGDIAISLIR
ncbi:hypothetical protein BCR39DRAFT_50573 [Naematelia encephala]|uniref:Uncharacterized protein n=1 Tax=Naematelia encephala TaxID=71784 RepID=A0A1Y2AIP7_9TREE|nr:hypothetical protein BCR39DRAFT_50573 [Naematelia encephala]